MGISVKGNSVTAILDCNEQDTQEIKRNKVTLKTDGIILFGQEIDDQEYFDVRCPFLSLKLPKLIIAGRHSAVDDCGQS